MQHAVRSGHVHLGGQAPTLQPRSNLIDRDGLQRATEWWHCIRQLRIRGQVPSAAICTADRNLAHKDLATGVRDLPLSSCTHHTGAAKVASTTPQRGVVGAKVKNSPR